MEQVGAAQGTHTCVANVPLKLGCPSQTYHTYQIAGLRLILGVDVTAGNESNASHSLPGLLRCIDRLPKNMNRP